MTHIWYWKPILGERNRKGMRCRVLVTRKSKVLVEMEDGEMVVALRYCVRQIVSKLQREAARDMVEDMHRGADD